MSEKFTDPKWQIRPSPVIDYKAIVLAVESLIVGGTLSFEHDPPRHYSATCNEGKMLRQYARLNRVSLSVAHDGTLLVLTRRTPR